MFSEQDLGEDTDGHSFTREKLLMRNGETDKAKAVYSKKYISRFKKQNISSN